MKDKKLTIIIEDISFQDDQAYMATIPELYNSVAMGEDYNELLDGVLFTIETAQEDKTGIFSHKKAKNYRPKLDFSTNSKDEKLNIIIQDIGEKDEKGLKAIVTNLNALVMGEDYQELFEGIKAFIEYAQEEKIGLFSDEKSQKSSMNLVKPI